MSTSIHQSNQWTADVQIPNDEKLHRIIIEAAKFNNLSAGDPLKCTEIIEQGKANGYDSDEVRDWLESEGYIESEGCKPDDKMPVPPQKDALGDLWKVNDSPQFLKSFRKWCDEKAQMRRQEYDDGTYQHPVEHSYSYKAELEKFVRAKDVGRAFTEEYDRFTTVLITYTEPRSKGESVAEHAQGYYSRGITRKRRDCIKATGRGDEYAGVSLLAPKDVASNPTAQMTHGHDALWIPGFASSECFDPLESMDGVDVSIRYHRSDKVSSPEAINRKELESKRGQTTALAQEVGSNLPVFTAIESFRDKMEVEAATNSAAEKATLDARDCPDYVERWSAHMSAGEDSDHSTNGVQRWRPLGQFKELADGMKADRDYGAIGFGAKASDEPDSAEVRVNSLDAEVRAKESTTHSDESRFTFSTERRDYGAIGVGAKASDEKGNSDESRFTFREYGRA